MDPKQIVRTGYDKVSCAYRFEQGGAYECRRAEWVDKLQLPQGAAVLELGCGCGLPVAQILAPRMRYLGVDMSPVQIERARHLVPAGRFQCADMSSLDFEPGSFDAVIALYAIIHLPLVEQPPLLQRMATWLRSGGQLLMTTGSRAWTGTEEDWLDVPGATMYWSHADAATYRRWLADCGLTIAWDEFIPEGAGGHQLFHAVRADGTQKACREQGGR